MKQYGSSSCGNRHRRILGGCVFGLASAAALIFAACSSPPIVYGPPGGYAQGAPGQPGYGAPAPQYGPQAYRQPAPGPAPQPFQQSPSTPVTGGNRMSAMAQAQTGAPAASQVADAPEFAYDPNMPTFVVAVLPLDYSASDLVSGGGPEGISGFDASQIGPGMAAQLTTALGGIGNVSILDSRALIDNGDGTYTCKLAPGELGPFVVKGTVTEFSETAELEERNKGGSLDSIGDALNVIGGHTGAPGANFAGDLARASNTNWKRGVTTRRGMVGMDLTLVDGRTGRVVKPYRCAGTFQSASAESGTRVFGIGGGGRQFAASALGQATRAAMNQAVAQTHQALQRVR